MTPDEFLAGLGVDRDTAPFVLDPSTLWFAGALQPEHFANVNGGVPLPLWTRPGQGSDEASGGTGRLDAFLDVVVSRPAPGPQILRVQVATLDDLERLRSVGDVGGVTIVPSLSAAELVPAGQARTWMRWTWPLRIGVLAGTEQGTWIDQMLSFPHAGQVYDVAEFDTNDDYEIVVVPHGLVGSMSPDVDTAVRRAPCVISIGDTPVAAQVADVIRHLGSAISISFAAPPIAWFEVFYSVLCHDLPIDAAVEFAHRETGVDALLAGPARGLDVTAAGHWSIAAATTNGTFAALLPTILTWGWDHESQGTVHVSEASRTARGRGEDPSVFVEPPAMAAPPDETEPASAERPALTPEEQPAARRLVARIWDETTKLDRALPPDRHLRLEVLIAIPETGDIAADQPTPLPQAPGPTIELEVSVTSSVWTTQPPPQPISVSRTLLTQPSTPALFDFDSPAAGLAQFDLIVTYRGKALQAARLVATVRATPGPSDLITLTTYEVSGADEPVHLDAAYDASLDGRGAELRRIDGHGGVITLESVREILDTFESIGSAVLGHSDAPVGFDDPDALEMLIELARCGANLHTEVSALGLDDAAAISVLVETTTRVFPLELVYGADAPRPDASPCRHIEQPPRSGRPCRRAGPDIVCPYAFWGLSRRVARTIAGERRAAGTPTTSLGVRSALYGATVIADADTPDDPKPSDRLAAAIERVGAVRRVADWDDWRTAIGDDHPELLVVLGHTEFEGRDPTLQIGTDSVLARPDISAREVCIGTSPQPLVIMLACATSTLGDRFGSLPGHFAAHGAAAVIATGSKVNGEQGADAAIELLVAIKATRGRGGDVAAALTRARRALVKRGLAIGLLLVAHGEIDMEVAT